jgi:hypothetical protein
MRKKALLGSGKVCLASFIHCHPKELISGGEMTRMGAKQLIKVYKS